MDANEIEAKLRGASQVFEKEKKELLDQIGARWAYILTLLSLAGSEMPSNIRHNFVEEIRRLQTLKFIIENNLRYTDRGNWAE